MHSLIAVYWPYLDLDSNKSTAQLFETTGGSEDSLDLDDSEELMLTFQDSY